MSIRDMIDIKLNYEDSYLYDRVMMFPNPDHES
jgi:hypothetical protein